MSTPNEPTTVSIDPDRARNEEPPKRNLLAEIEDTNPDLMLQANDFLGHNRGIPVGWNVQFHLGNAIQVVIDAANAVGPADGNPMIPTGGGPGGAGLGSVGGGGGGAVSTGGGGGASGTYGSLTGSSSSSKTSPGSPGGPTDPGDPETDEDKLIAKYGVLHPEDCPCVFHTSAYRSVVANRPIWQTPDKKWPWPERQTADLGTAPSRAAFTTVANGIGPGGCIPPWPREPSPIELLPPHGSDCPCPYHKTGSYPSPSGPIPFPPNGPLDPWWDEALPDPAELPTKHTDGTVTDPWPDILVSTPKPPGPAPVPPVPDPQLEILRDRIAELELDADQNQFNLEIETQRLALNEEKTIYLERQAAGLESARELLIASGAPPETVAAIDFALRMIEEQRTDLANEAAQIKIEITSLEQEEARLNRELEQAKADLAVLSGEIVAQEDSSVSKIPPPLPDDVVKDVPLPNSGQPGPVGTVDHDEAPNTTKEGAPAATNDGAPVATKSVPGVAPLAAVPPTDRTMRVVQSTQQWETMQLGQPTQQWEMMQPSQATHPAEQIDQGQPIHHFEPLGHRTGVQVGQAAHPVEPLQNGTAKNGDLEMNLSQPIEQVTASQESESMHRSQPPRTERSGWKTV